MVFGLAGMAKEMLFATQDEVTLSIITATVAQCFEDLEALFC
jgi:hypothetical protein